jgi:hypothetical protein
MAIRIPTLDAPSVAPTAMPTPYENPNVPSGAAGGLALASEAISGVAKVEQKFKHDADGQAILGAQNAFRSYTDAGLEQVRRAEGVNAAAAANKFYADADKKAKDIFGGLVNEEQKLAFSNWANDELRQTRKIGESHVGEQIKSADALEFNGANSGGLDRVVKSPLVPGLAETEADELRRRIYGYEENGVRVSGYAARHGIPKDAADSLFAEKVSVIYAAKAERLMDLGFLQQAQSVVEQHRTELGKNADELLKRVEALSRNARADATAEQLAKKYAFVDGTVDSTKALAEIDSTMQAGQERDAARLALGHRAEQAKVGRLAYEADVWDKVAGEYENNGQSLWSAVHSPFWSKATPDQQEKLRARARADAREANSQPLTEDQLRSYGRAMNDIIERPDFWGTAPDSVLGQNADYNNLPPRYREHLRTMVAQSHKDRQNPDQQMRLAESVIRERAQNNSILSNDTRKKHFDAWKDDDKEAFLQIQDKVAPKIADWHADEKNRGKRIPNELVQRFVDDVTREGYLKDGRWWWFGDPRASQADAALRPASDLSEHPFVPILQPDEESIGRQVQMRRGFNDKSTPAAFTPDALQRAAREHSEASAGPGPQEREAIVGALKAAGAKNPRDPDLIQQAYERKRLRYVR